MSATAMCVVDRDGQQIAENAPWRELLLGDVHDPWRDPNFTEAVTEVVDRRSTERSTRVVHELTDATREFVARMLAIPGSDQTMVTLADVTAFRTRERAVQTEEERIRRLWERLTLATSTSQVGVWEYEIGTSLIHVDDTMCALYEIPPRAVVHESELLERIEPDDLEPLRLHFAQALDSGQEVDWTFRIRLRSGGVRWVHLDAGSRTCSSSGRIRLIGTTMDVTRRRDEEEHLRTLSLVAERTTDAVLLVRAGIVEWTNLAAERLLASRFGELCGRVIPPALVDEGTEEREIQVRGKGPRWVSVDAQPLLPDRPGGATVMFVRDLTERRAIEAERRMSHKLDAVGRLAAGLAHEINTPVQYAGDTLTFVTDAWDGITGLLTHLQSSVERGPLHAAQVEAALEKFDVGYLVERMPSALGRMAEAMSRIGQIVSTMREFGDPDRARTVQADLRQALAVALAVARPEIDPIAEVVLDLSPVPAVVCNLAQVHDLLHALLLNAVEAIAARSDGHRGQVIVWTRQAEDLVELGIEDDGCGMPPDILARIFDPFFSTKPEGEGRGLGLTTARLVVARHGGSIDVDSQPDVGTRVVIRLPAVRNEQEVA